MHQKQINHNLSLSSNKCILSLSPPRQPGHKYSVKKKLHSYDMNSMANATKILFFPTTWTTK